jgi:hypothetical protein
MPRSVPFYPEMQRMIGDAGDFVEGRSMILAVRLAPRYHLDQLLRGGGHFCRRRYWRNAGEMSQNVRHGFSSKVELVCADLNQGIYVENASSL